MIKYLIEQNESEVLLAEELQNLKIPEDYKRISKLIDEARNPNSPNIKEFKKLREKADMIIGESFGLNQSQIDHINKRLAVPPLDVLTPRWPWKAAALRTIQEYDFDRFA